MLSTASHRITTPYRSTPSPTRLTNDQLTSLALKAVVTLKDIPVGQRVPWSRIFPGTFLPAEIGIDLSAKISGLFPGLILSGPDIGWRPGWQTAFPGVPMGELMREIKAVLASGSAEQAGGLRHYVAQVGHIIAGQGRYTFPEGFPLECIPAEIAVQIFEFECLYPYFGNPEIAC